MNLTNLVVAMLVGTGIILGMSSFYTEIATQYPSGTGNWTNSTTFGIFNKSFTEINERTEDLQNHTIGIATKSISDLTILQDITFAFLDVGGILSQIPNIMTEFINQMVQILGIVVPTWLISLVLTIMAFLVAMRVVSIFLKREEI